jgi:S-adenosylhomocysteine hydrolase
VEEKRMNDPRKTRVKRPIENPFEKVTVEQFNDDYSLIAYLFAKPERAIYNKLIGRENYIIVGGWGSGKTMLLKYLAAEAQMEDRGVGIKGVKRSSFIGVYIKPGRGPFKPFLKPGGEFKDGGEILFGHYFNLLILERLLSVILYLRDKSVFDVTPEIEANLARKISNRFSAVKGDLQIGFNPRTTAEISDLTSLKNNVASYRYEIETFLNTRDLEKDISYETQLSIHPTNIKTFLDETIKDIKEIISDITQKRFYLLLDECEQFSKGQQKIINTLIKQRLTTLVFKLASRPPDIQTMETIDEGIGLTDRECKHLYLDREYNPTSAPFKKLCGDVARKRLARYGYAVTDIRKIFGKFAVEDEIDKASINSYLRRNYPTKERVKNKFGEVYKDFKVAATFQILSKKRLEKKYAGFDTLVMLSSGIMVHFLELCRDAFNLSLGNNIFRDKSGRISFKQIPLLIKTQDKAAKKISEIFYQDIRGRAQSLKDAPINIEFGGKIQYIISVLGGIFREKLMSFNEPESARIEIPEGISSLDNKLENPVRQIFETAIAISVFQESEPYMPRRIGGIRPPTYIVNRILAPYLSISPRPRWRTKIPAEVFNKILTVTDNELKSEVLGRRKKKEKVQTVKKEISPIEKQLSLQFSHVSESMPVLAYLSNKVNNQPFKGKTLLVLLHFLTDLIPFIEACKKAGVSPDNTILFYKDYLYPRKEEIKETLKRDGCKVFSVAEVDDMLREMTSKIPKPTIVIEDGGHIVPRLHKTEFKELANATLGAVEQTTRGIRSDQQIKEPLFSIISIPSSKLKNTFEPPHVARTVINNIQKLLHNINFSARKGLVIGYGSIGEQIALFLRDTLMMSITVYDSDPTSLVKARQQGFPAEENLVNGVTDKFMIVGATGETVIQRKEILAMDHNVHLVSASSEQWEFCISELNAVCSEKDDLVHNGEKIGTRFKIRNTEKYINLVADGYPINFWKSESMPNEVSDLIMSLIFVSAVKTATNSSLQQGINSEITNKLDEEYEIGKMYLEYYK